MTDGTSTIFDRINTGIDGILASRSADGIALAMAKFLPGGLPALLDLLRADGHGAAVDSWVGPGPNQPVPAEALARILPPATAEALAGELRLRPERLSVALAQALPIAVDRESPDGRVRPQPRFDAARILAARTAARGHHA